MKMKTMGWGLAAVLCGMCSFIAAAWGLALFLVVVVDVSKGISIPRAVVDHWAIFFLAVVFLLALLSLCACAAINRWCRKKNKDASGYGRMAALVFLLFVLVGYVATTIDGPPPEHDFTRADILSPAKDVETTYAIIMAYRDGGPIRVTNRLDRVWPEVQTNALAHAAEIEQAWKSIEEHRNVIEKLDTFEGIAGMAPSTVFNHEIPILGFLSFRTMARTYCAYALLRVEQGKPEEGVRELVRLNSVARKALPYMAVLVDKLIWLAVTAMTSDAAYRIARHPNATPQVLATLKGSFTPLAGRDWSLRGAFIGECLGIKDNIKDENFLGSLQLRRNARTMEVTTAEIRNSVLKRCVARVIYGILVDYNRTVRDLVSFWDCGIEGAEKSPPDGSKFEAFVSAYSKKSFIVNPGGRVYLLISVPGFRQYGDDALRGKVLSDLLAAEIQRRLGEKVDLIDPYTGKPCLIDEKTGTPFSVGPDRKAGTQDDIQFVQ